MQSSLVIQIRDSVVVTDKEDSRTHREIHGCGFDSEGQTKLLLLIHTSVHW
jgi:hypothetical protein